MLRTTFGKRDTAEKGTQPRNKEWSKAATPAILGSVLGVFAEWRNFERGLCFKETQMAKSTAIVIKQGRHSRQHMEGSY
jgi:hypothetical protein